MSEVRMSLEKYDEMKSRLDLLERAFAEIFKPKVDGWSLNYYKEHPDYTMSVYAKSRDEYSEDVKELVESYIYRHIPDELRGIGNIDMSYTHHSHALFTIEHSNISEDEESESDGNI